MKEELKDQPDELEKKEHADLQRRDVLATAALWIAPLAWLADLTASSSLSPVACAHGRNAILHVPALAALLFIAIAVVLRRSDAAPGDPGRLFLSRIAFGLALFSALVVVVSFLPIAIVPPCAS